MKFYDNSLGTVTKNGVCDMCHFEAEPYWRSATDVLSCTNCHSNVAHTVEVGPDDLSYTAPGRLCSNCHVVADWSEIEGTEHNVATNGDGSCATCHNSPRQEVIDTIASGTRPTHCLDCHLDKELTPHGSHDATVFAWTASCGTARNNFV